jgi:quaternary ammonium compound-resistance protein SugE
VSKNLAWILLLIAGVLEVCWVAGLKYTEGFTRFVPSVMTVLALGLSMFLMSKVMQVLPIGTSYGIWVGIGAFGAAAVGIFLFKESASPMKLLFMALLLISIIGLKLTSEH